MKISSISIKNFRSIEQANFKTDNFNILVGQNNCGKTNFFEAIEYFFNGLGRGSNLADLKYKREPNREIEVSIEFSGAQQGVSRMLNQANRTKIERALGGADVVTIVRSSESSKRKFIVSGNEIDPGTGFDTALNDFLPKFEYVDTKQYYDSVAKYSKTSPIGIMLSGVLTTILEQNQQYKDFQEKFKDLFGKEDSEIRVEFDRVGDKVQLNLARQFPDSVSVKFEVTPPVFDELLKNFDTTIDDGIPTLAEEKGDGMQRALMLAIIQAYADFRRESDTGKSFLFFIDEAELHLHPAAQRNLKNVLHGLSQRDDQVFISSHSSVLIADDLPGQRLLCAEKAEGKTSIEEVSAAGKPYIVYELLGGSPSDLLLPRNFVIVEGPSEIELLTRIINRFYTDKPQVQLVQANGDTDQAERTINAIEQIFKPLASSIYRERLILLIDQPSTQRQAGVKAFRQRNPHLTTNNQLFELPVRDIEQCYPDQADPVYRNWRRSQAEVDAMKGDQKKQLAKHVGDNITQAQFENDMNICFSALQKAWELAFPN